MTEIHSGRVRFPASVKPLMTPLDSVRQFEGNPNNGEIDSIIESIRVNGFTTVITVDAKTRQIVSGNHRWQALHSLGATEAPMIFVDYDSEEQAKRILIADNRTGQLARPDEALLAEMLKELDDSELGLFGTGFDQDSYMDLLSALNADPASEFGGQPEPAIHGIYEITLSFTDRTEREEVYAELIDRYGDEHVRRADV